MSVDRISGRDRGLAGYGRPVRFIDRRASLLHALHDYGVTVDDARRFVREAKAEGRLRFEVEVTRVPAGMRLPVPAQLLFVWRERGWFVDVYRIEGPAR